MPAPGHPMGGPSIHSLKENVEYWKKKATQLAEAAREKTVEATKALPEVTVKKNGYEVRADVLAYAQKQLLQEYEFKLGKWKQSAKLDHNGKFVFNQEYPEIPGVDKVIEAAEKMYQFVCKNSK